MINEIIQYALAIVFLIGALILVWYVRAKPWLDVVKHKNFITFTNFETVPKAIRLDHLCNNEIIEQLNQVDSDKDEKLEIALEEEALRRKLIYKLRNV